MNRRDLYARARRALATGDAASWEAAECMAALYDECGETQRTIAAELDVSQVTVQRHLACWRLKLDSPVNQALPFSVAMANVLGRANGTDRREIPKTPEKRAALVAELLADKRVADAPVVQQVQTRHAERRQRADAAEWNREHSIPTRTASDRDARRRSTATASITWATWADTIKAATRALGDLTGEVERTGLPNVSKFVSAGDTIRALRALARAVERAEAAIADAGIGRAMAN